MAERTLRECYVFGPVPVPRDVPFVRADLELYQINHFRPSFVGHVFFNDPQVALEAIEDEGLALRPSYAGRFAVFGHQRCLGDEGHCEVDTNARRFDDRPSHPLTRAFRRVVVTTALERALADADQLIVTIVVSATVPDDAEVHGDLLDVGGVQVATFA